MHGRSGYSSRRYCNFMSTLRLPRKRLVIEGGAEAALVITHWNFTISSCPVCRIFQWQWFVFWAHVSAASLSIVSSKISLCWHYWTETVMPQHWVVATCHYHDDEIFQSLPPFPIPKIGKGIRLILPWLCRPFWPRSFLHPLMIRTIIMAQ